MRSFDNLDALTIDRVSGAGHDQSRQRPLPAILDRPGHCGRGLSRPDHDQPAAGRRQKRLNMVSRLRGVDRRVEEAPQKIARIDDRVHAGVATRLSGPSVFVREPMPSIVTATLEPSAIEPTPSEVPQAITSPGSSDMSREIRLTSSSGENIMSESGYR